MLESGICNLLYNILFCVYNVKEKGETPGGYWVRIKQFSGTYFRIWCLRSMAIYRNIYFRGKNNEIIRSLNCQITSQSHFMLGNTTCHWQHHLLLPQSKERTTTVERRRPRHTAFSLKQIIQLTNFSILVVHCVHVYVWLKRTS